jgi:hypothetical protein
VRVGGGGVCGWMDSRWPCDAVWSLSEIIRRARVSSSPKLPCREIISARGDAGTGRAACQVSRGGGGACPPQSSIVMDCACTVHGVSFLPLP